MTEFEDVLKRVLPNHAYNSEDLARLQAVFDEACKDLGVAPKSARGEALAAFLFQSRADVRAR